MSYKLNPFTGTFDKVEKGSLQQSFELGFDLANFNLQKIVVVAKIMVFENSALSTRGFTKTGPKEITFVPAVPAGTVLNIIQL